MDKDSTHRRLSAVKSAIPYNDMTVKAAASRRPNAVEDDHWDTAPIVRPRVQNTAAKSVIWLKATQIWPKSLPLVKFTTW